MPKVIPEYKENARKKIIKSALTTFYEKGYNDTKMDDIARNLGVSKGAIYQYFDSKDKLFLEAFDLYLEEKRAAITSYLSRVGVDGFASDTFFDLSIPTLQDSNCAVDLTAELPANEQLKLKVAQYYQEEIKNLETILNDFRKNSIIKADVDCKLLAFRLIGMLEGLKKLLLYGFEPQKIKRIWACFADAIIKEIKDN
jgi:AcrR family transcriptional regulator